MFCPDSCDSLILRMVAMWSSERANLNVIHRSIHQASCIMIPDDTVITSCDASSQKCIFNCQNLKHPLEAEMRWATKFGQVKGKVSRHNTKKLRLQWAARFLVGSYLFESEIWDPVWRNMVDLLGDYSAIWWTFSWSSQNQFSCDLGLLKQDPLEETERAFFQTLQIPFHPQPLHLLRRHMFLNLATTANFKPWRTQDDPLSWQRCWHQAETTNEAGWDNLRWKQSQDWNFLRCLWHSSRRPVISTTVIGIHPSKNLKIRWFLQYNQSRRAIKESNLAQKKSSKRLWKSWIPLKKTLQKKPAFPPLDLACQTEM